LKRISPVFLRSAAVLLLSILSVAAAPRENWQATLTAPTPGPFPAPRSLHATYRFAWSGFTAATAEVSWTKTAEDFFQLKGTGQTVGLARALWKLDVKHTALADADTLRPIEMHQIENVRSKKIVTDLNFDANGVIRKRMEGHETVPKAKPFSFPNLFDLQSSLLFLRSQSLENRSAHRIVVYPATSAYLATVTVLAREKISVRAGTYKAIKLDLQLQRVGKNRDLEPHRKFRRATAWVSDDADRLLLRIEAQIFVGTVSAELQSVHFDDAKSSTPSRPQSESPAPR
jgi:Protein of unknown function (DUF3108)